MRTESLKLTTKDLNFQQGLLERLLGLGECVGDRIETMLNVCYAPGVFAG